MNVLLQYTLILAPSESEVGLVMLCLSRLNVLGKHAAANGIQFADGKGAANLSTQASHATWKHDCGDVFHDEDEANLLHPAAL